MILDIILTILLLLVAIVLVVVYQFLCRINFVNSCLLGIVAGVLLMIQNVFPFQAHPAIAFLVGVVVFVLTYFLQKTNVGFWVFAAVMSLVWAFLPARFLALLGLFDSAPSWPWFWVLLASFTVVNVGSHFRSRDSEISSVEAVLSSPVGYWVVAGASSLALSVVLSYIACLCAFQRDLVWFFVIAFLAEVVLVALKYRAYKA
jgi:hypothetical protein